jgi:hypothetical protein
MNPFKKIRLNVTYKQALLLCKMFPFLATAQPSSWIDDECEGIKQTQYRFKPILNVAGGYIGFVSSK